MYVCMYVCVPCQLKRKRRRKLCVNTIDAVERGSLPSCRSRIASDCHLVKHGVVFSQIRCIRMNTFDHDAVRGVVSREKVKREKKWNRAVMRRRRSEGTGVLRKASEHSIPWMNASCDTISKLQYDIWLLHLQGPIFGMKIPNLLGGCPIKDPGVIYHWGHAHPPWVMGHAARCFLLSLYSIVEFCYHCTLWYSALANR